jgi:hypothetical protein
MTRKVPILIYLVIILLTAVVSVLILRSSGEEPVGINIRDHFNEEWAEDPLWDDGKAEVAAYRAERSIYGQTRRFDYILILVKETFNEEFNVKTDDYSRSGLFDVMKVNKFARIETQYYPYHFLSSIFLRREDPVRIHKFTNSSQEWCGNTFKHFTRENTGITYFYDSYWDGEGRGSTILPLDVIFEDQLTYSLRTLKFQDGVSFECPIVETQVTNRATPPVIYDAKLTVRSHMEDPENSVWEVQVALEKDKTNTYWFSATYPNILIKMEAWDGRKLELDHMERETYWQE